MMRKQKDLALLIKQGLEHQNVIESEQCFLENIFGEFHVCVLGAALTGCFGSPDKALEAVEKEKDVFVKLNSKELVSAPDYAEIAACLLEIDFDLAEAIDKTHMSGIPASEIADSLERQIFSY